MNNNIKNTLRMGFFAAAGAAALFSCTDTWNDHYQAAPVTKYSGTTMQALKEKAPGFAQVVEAAGFDRELKSENVYTIWAPQLSTEEAQTLAALAKVDSAKVVDQFIKNHIARYAQPYNEGELDVTLLNEKEATVAGGKFGEQAITANNNISCANGILHLIDGVHPYNFNLYEKIEDLHNPTLEGASLYKFLAKWNADSLDEARSVSRGVDENGEKIWVDSVTIRNNTVLKNVKALLYREDSSYVALIPTDEAYAERYAGAAKLLNFNPVEDTKAEGAVDSLRDYYANMFAMTDLFYNNTDNQHKADSLKSTNYTSQNWPYGIYYTKEPRNLHPDKQVNDILAKSGDPVECSNGTAYIIDEYPMATTEQYFKKLSYKGAQLYRLIDNTADGTTGLYTNNMALNDFYNSTLTANIYRLDSIFDEQGRLDSVAKTLIYRSEQDYQCLYINATSNSSPKVAFQVPNTLSGKYKIYLVTVPFLATKIRGAAEVDPNDFVATRFRFYSDIWQRQNSGAKIGEYPSSGTRFQVPETGSEGSGRYFEPTVKFNEYGVPAMSDTLLIGEVELDNAYYGRDEAGVLIQFLPQTTSGNRNNGTHTNDLLISEIIFMPVDENAAPEPTPEPAEVRSAAKAMQQNKKYITEFTIKQN